MADILLAIPAYNEASKIIEVCRELQRIPNCEIRVFDDGSSDESLQKLISSEISFHFLAQNKGLAANFQVILQHFLSEQKYEWLITVDGDGQFNPTDVAKIAKEIEGGKFDFISGSRFTEKSHQKKVPWLRRIVNKLIARLISSLMGKGKRHRRITDATCGLRAYSRNSANLLLGISGHSYTLDSIVRLMDSDLDLFEIPIEVTYFDDRKSVISGNLAKYGRYILEVFFSIIAVSSVRYLFRFLITSLILSILILTAFLWLSLRDGQFKGWLYLAGTGGFLGISTLVLLGMFTTIRQAKMSRDYIDGRLRLISESSNPAFDLHKFQCKKCRNF